MAVKKPVDGGGNVGFKVTPKPKPTASKSFGSADAAEQRHWTNSGAGNGAFPTAVGYGLAVDQVSRKLSQEAAVQKWNAALAQNARNSGGGGGGGGGSRGYSSGGGGRRGGGGGGGGKPAGPSAAAQAAWATMLGDYNAGKFEGPLNQLILANTQNANSAKDRARQAHEQLLAQLGALGPSPYANMPPQFSVGSVDQTGQNLMTYLQQQGGQTSRVGAEMDMRRQAEAQDAQRLQAMYAMLNQSAQAGAQSRTAQAGFANTGAQQSIDDQLRMLVAQLDAQKAQAAMAEKQRLLEFALQNEINPTGFTR
jgi:hypothetical protein